MHKNPDKAAAKLQDGLHQTAKWAKTWRINLNKHIVITKCHGGLPCVRHALGQTLNLENTHMEQKFRNKFKKHYWMLGRKS